MSRWVQVLIVVLLLATVGGIGYIAYTNYEMRDDLAELEDDVDHLDWEIEQLPGGSSDGDSLPPWWDDSSSYSPSEDVSGFEPTSGDCVVASSGEAVDCDYPGAVDREVYDEHNGG